MCDFLSQQEDWGIDDDGDWGSKTDPSQPKKETQEQRIQRVMTPGIFEIVTAFFLHLTVLGFYVYVHVYDGTVYKRNKGMGFIGVDKFGGRWKYLTYINMVSLLYWVSGRSVGYMGRCFFIGLQSYLPPSLSSSLSHTHILTQFSGSS